MTPDPHRKIGEPLLGLAPVPVTASPTGVALLGQNLIRVVSVVGGLAMLVGGIFAVFLPQPWAVTGASISAAVAALALKIEAMGPGLRQSGTTVPTALQTPQLPAVVVRSIKGPPL